MHKRRKVQNPVCRMQPLEMLQNRTCDPSRYFKAGCAAPSRYFKVRKIAAVTVRREITAQKASAVSHRVAVDNLLADKAQLHTYIAHEGAEAGGSVCNI